MTNSIVSEINISELRVGDRLPDTSKSAYGYFTNRHVSDIYITKGGRYRVMTTNTYMDNDLGAQEPRTSNLFNGAVAATYKIKVLR